jgi:hypothetical protein
MARPHPRTIAYLRVSTPEQDVAKNQTDILLLAHRKQLVLCQILIDWYGDCMDPLGGPRTWNAPEGGPPCQGKEHIR